MKKALKVMLIILAVVLGLLFTKNTIAKIAFERGVEFATGLKLRVSGFSVGIFKSRVIIAGLKLYNPKVFEDAVMVDIPNLYVDYNLPAIFKGKMHLEDVRLDLKEFVVIKNNDGKVNIDSLKIVQEQKESKGKAKPKEEAKPKAPDIQIDNLELKLGKVIYKDYSKTGGPSVKEFNLNLDEKYANITNTNAVVSIILIKVLTKTALGGITNINIKGLDSTVSGSLSKATAVASDTAAKATKTAGETGKSVTETVKNLKESFNL